MTASVTLISTPRETSGAATSFSQSFTTVVGRQYFVQCSTENQAITAATLNGSSLVSGLVNSFTNSSVSNPFTYLYQFVAASTTSTIAITVASAQKLGIALYEIGDYGGIRASANSGGVSGTMSATCSSSPGDVVALFMSSWYPVGSVSPGAGVSSVSGTGSLTGITLWGGTKAGAPTAVAGSASFSSGQWSVVAVSIKPATIVPAPTNGVVSRSVAGDQITVSTTISSIEVPCAQATITPATGSAVGPVTMSVSGTSPNWSASCTFTDVADGTWTPSVFSGNSGGSDTDAAASVTVDVVEIDAASFTLGSYTLPGTVAIAVNPTALRMAAGDSRLVRLKVTSIATGLPVSGYLASAAPVVAGSATATVSGATDAAGTATVTITALAVGDIVVNVT